MIYLREIQLQDISVINKWRNDNEVVDLLTANFRYVNMDTDLKWYENYMQNRNSQVRCSICLESTDKVIGAVYLTGIDYINSSCDFGIMIGDKEYWNKKIGTIVIKKILNHAFNNIGLNRISLVALEDNSRAINVYQKAGFIKEGIARQAIYKNGKFKNLIYMSIIKEDYIKLPEDK
ncbi:GNAT family N-acetyltransferase [Clostridium sp. 19966]|uniref:GNAT family N-acetyltransferase n=1 Tax=Clostridium sp. 19966 TaxID=2768166 RepID=UPI0028E031B0|nr:GNAT family protein [Clostridium sp. 19966]MDT8716141.1 GNAT family N-acetyltransferase [Clostridium sp. 19966]